MLTHVVFDPVVLDADEQIAMGGNKGNIERIIRCWETGCVGHVDIQGIPERIRRFDGAG